MTLAEIKASDKDVLTPADIADVLNVHQQAINIMARDNRLPFPAFTSGNRTKLPREGFLNWQAGNVISPAEIKELTKAVIALTDVLKVGLSIAEIARGQ